MQTLVFSSIRGALKIWLCYGFLLMCFSIMYADVAKIEIISHSCKYFNLKFFN